MNQVTATDEASRLNLGDGDQPVIQNLGPADVFFGRSNTVSPSSGIRLKKGEGFSFDKTLREAGWTGVWVVTAESTEADVRYESIG